MRDLEAVEKEVISMLSNSTSAEALKDVLDIYLFVYHDLVTQPFKLNLKRSLEMLTCYLILKRRQSTLN